MKDKWSEDFDTGFARTDKVFKVFWAMFIIFGVLALAIVVGYAIGPVRQILLVEDILKGIGR